MIRQFLCALTGGCVAFSLNAAEAPAPDAPKSCSPALEQAAQALSQRNLPAARSGFEAVLSEASAPAFVRALACVGLAETALAETNNVGAVAVWKRQAADATLNRFHRELAERRLLEADRIRNGQSARTAAEFRETLPANPDSATALHVSTRGSDAGDGSASQPFATVERAREAIRQLKKDNAGKLPASGVRVMMEAGDYPVRRTFRLSAEDSGTTNAPVVYQTRPGTSVRWGCGQQQRQDCGELVARSS